MAIVVKFHFSPTQLKQIKPSNQSNYPKQSNQPNRPNKFARAILLVDDAIYTGVNKTSEALGARTVNAKKNVATALLISAPALSAMFDGKWNNVGILTIMNATTSVFLRLQIENTHKKENMSSGVLVMNSEDEALVILGVAMRLAFVSLAVGFGIAYGLNNSRDSLALSVWFGCFSIAHYFINFSDGGFKTLIKNLVNSTKNFFNMSPALQE